MCLCVCVYFFLSRVDAVGINLFVLDLDHLDQNRFCFLFMVGLLLFVLELARSWPKGFCNFVVVLFMLDSSRLGSVCVAVGST